MRVGVVTLWALGVACSKDPPCVDSAAVQLLTKEGTQFSSCQVDITPAFDVGEERDFQIPLPAYEFTMPPVFHFDPWACPERNLTLPKAGRVECTTLSGPEPTICIADGGCLLLEFWGDDGTKLRTALGTSKFSATAKCDGQSVSFVPYDPDAPSTVVHCRDPDTFDIEH
jgi:hypothetical protein